VCSSARLEITLCFGDKQLYPGKYYHYSANDSVKIDVCRFYLSEFTFCDYANKVLRKSNQIMLCDINDEQTLHLDLPKTPLKTKYIRFRTGIDSITHTKGIQQGKLDPVHGMYWTWQTGFIQFKIEGYCSASKSLDKSFMMHFRWFSTAIYLQ
jgi:hypothetical protein